MFKEKYKEKNKERKKVQGVIEILDVKNNIVI